jgi:hypothetical protein
LIKINYNDIGGQPMYLGSHAITRPNEDSIIHAHRGPTKKNALTTEEKKKKRLIVKESKRKNWR